MTIDFVTSLHATYIYGFALFGVVFSLGESLDVMQDVFSYPVVIVSQ